MPESQLVLDGDVEQPLRLTATEIAALDPRYLQSEAQRQQAKRPGDAVLLAGLLAAVRPKPGVAYLTLHASADDFHASIPLSSVQEHALVIYRLGGAPLPQDKGGPFRFLIPDVAACHTHEIDECANVKFVDRIEFSILRGHDNRPTDEAEHRKLHERDG
jgi:hypothetical protein